MLTIFIYFLGGNGVILFLLGTYVPIILRNRFCHFSTTSFTTRKLIRSILLRVKSNKHWIRSDFKIEASFGVTHWVRRLCEMNNMFVLLFWEWQEKGGTWKEAGSANEPYFKNTTQSWIFNSLSPWWSTNIKSLMNSQENGLCEAAAAAAAAKRCVCHITVQLLGFIYN